MKNVLILEGNQLTKQMLVGAVGQAAGSAVVPAVDAGKGICRYLKRQHDYVKNLDKNFLQLQRAKEDLLAKECDINGVVERNEFRMEMTSQTQTWLKGVTTLKDEITYLETRYKSTPKYLRKMYHFMSLKKLSKDIIKKCKDITHHLKLGQQLSIARVEKKYPKKTYGVLSQDENAEKLMEYLREMDVKKVGIWGPAGVGKTTILKILNDKLDETCMFELVIWVGVGKGGSVGKIQKEIVERLRLDVDGSNSEQLVATIISAALKNKKYLLVLDNVFSKIELEDVGMGHSHGKLVLASRFKKILDDMIFDEKIYVERMSNAEAQVLFRKVVGPAVFDHPLIMPIAEKVVRECGNLPQVINAVASNLKGERRQDLWLSKLSRLQLSSWGPMKERAEIHNALEIAYEDLNEVQKNCLKYVALFPQDYDLYGDYLVECWKAQKFIHNASTLKQAREEGCSILHVLLNACLLENGRTSEYVRMPIDCRIMARDKFQKHELLVGENEESIEIEENEEKWKEAKMISFMCTRLQNLPESPKCQKLSTLFLQENEELTIIPNSFFHFMSELNVLDLQCTGIKSLPPSISHLIKLRGLYLNNCRFLSRLPEEIIVLEELEVLDIHGTGIRSLPVEIGKLVNLRCLRVSFACYIGNQNHVGAQPVVEIAPNYVGAQPVGERPPNHVAAQPMDILPTNIVVEPVEEMVPCNVVQRLPLLEELLVNVDANEPNEILDQIAKGVGDEILHKIARDVGALTQLNSLSFYFPSQECFETFSNERQSNVVKDFRSFKIQVGTLVAEHYQGRDIFGCSAKRHLKYLAGRGTPPAINKLLKEASSFELIGHHDVQSLSDFGIDEMGILEVCIVDGCNEMTTIFGNSVTLVDRLPLKRLYIYKLEKLDCIWEGSAVPGRLACLTTLILKDCPKITKLLSCEMSGQLLPQLQHLRVEKCAQLAKVIEAGEIIEVPSEVPSFFPKLKTLELVNLQNLVSICDNNALEWPSLKQLEIKNCLLLKSLSLSKTNAAQLRSIKCNEDWWKELVFQDHDVKPHLQRICRFL